MKKFALLFTLLCGNAVCQAASFDCGKASTFVEKAICADPALGGLDDALSEGYKGALAANTSDEARSALRTSQKAWLADRNKCSSNKCLEDLYRKRINQLCEQPEAAGARSACKAMQVVTVAPQQAPAQATAQEVKWVHVAEGAKATAYVDSSRLRREGSFLIAWSLQSLKDEAGPGPAPNGREMWSRVVLLAIDCTSMGADTRAQYGYADRMGKGAVVWSANYDATTPKVPPPGSLNEAISKTACFLATGSGLAN